VAKAAAVVAPLVKPWLPRRRAGPGSPRHRRAKHPRASRRCRRRARDAAAPRSRAPATSPRHAADLTPASSPRPPLQISSTWRAEGASRWWRSLPLSLVSWRRLGDRRRPTPGAQVVVVSSSSGPSPAMSTKYAYLFLLFLLCETELPNPRLSYLHSDLI
jgi:hypothetical protein